MALSNILRRNFLALFTVYLFLIASSASARPYQLAFLGKATAPNAGGQDAYALKLLTGPYEWSAFQNTYLLVEDAAIAGVTLDYRLSFCETLCFWQFYTQGGGGFSNAGPILQITWGTILPLLPIWLPMETPRWIPSLRVDFTSQFILTKWRAIAWSYPFWVGLSIAF